MKLSLATPEKIVFSGSASDVLLNAEKGQINLLERHANIITLVMPGTLSVKSPEKGLLKFEVSKGVLKVEGDSISVLCNQITTLAAA